MIFFVLDKEIWCVMPCSKFHLLHMKMPRSISGTLHEWHQGALYQLRFIIIVISCSLTYTDVAIEIQGAVVMECTMNFEGGIAIPLSAYGKLANGDTKYTACKKIPVAIGGALYSRQCPLP